MSVALSGIPSGVASILQDRTLERQFHDSLFPNLVYRLDADPEKWAANLGEQKVFTRTGLIKPKITPLVPGHDPQPSSYGTEQWEAFASQHGDAIDTHMPTSNVTLASLYMRNSQQLGMNAGQTLDRLARNRLFSSYLGGETSVTVAAGGGAQQVQVASINGFTQVLYGGRLTPVSSAAPLAGSTTTGEVISITGAVPADPKEPRGPGVLTLAAGLAGALALRDGVLASTRSLRLRVGGSATVDGLGSTNILTLNDFISAVARLRSNSVPPHPDGRYHVHLSSHDEAELFRDAAWRNLFQGTTLESYEYKNLVIREGVGCLFFRNEEDPRESTVGTQIALPGGAGGAVVAPEIGGEISTASGLPIRRTIVTGGGVLMEHYLDESKYITEAGVTGKIGEFSIINGGLQVMTDRIRYILRSPQDRLQQVVGSAWSWGGDFATPSDLLSGDSARHKRAVVIEHI